MSKARDAQLDEVLIGGREQRTIEVLDYDDAWPSQFEYFAERVRAALGDRALSIEHIGSTAVVGLAAKPIIDILLIVNEVQNESGYVTALEAAGFILRVREPHHRMLRTPEKDMHLHVLEPGSAEIDAYLDLRDWLRVCEEDRALYAALKKALARQEWSDMNYYADAKSETVQAILGRAQKWRATQGP